MNFADLQEALLLVFRPILTVVMALIIVGSILGGILTGLLEVSKKNKL